MNQEKEPQKQSPEETVSPEKEKETESPAETAAEEPKAEAQPSEEAKPQQKKKKKKDGPSFFQSEKFKHGGTATAFTAGFIAVVVLVNVLVGILGDKYPSINVDVTKSGTNTLSTQAVQIVDKVKIPTTITVCATKAACESNQVVNGADYSQVSRLLSKTAERNSSITLNYIDLDKDPAFAAKYQGDNLTAGDVVVVTDKRYRVLTVSDLFTSQTSSDGTSATYYSNVDAAIASALNQVISESVPVAAFDTSHTEKMDSSVYQKLLKSNSFETKDFNLLTEKIPEKTQLLVIGCPTTDLTDAETAKIDAFLHDKSSSSDRSVLITYSAGQGMLPKLNSYLAQWGLSAQSDSYIEETDAQKCDGSSLNFLSNIQTELKLGGSKTDYGYFLTPYSCPINITAKTVGTKNTYSLIKSNDTTVVYKGESKTPSAQSAQNIGALSQDTMEVNGKTVHANVIALGSTYLFAGDFLNATAFGNAAYVTDLSHYAVGTGSEATKVTTTNHELYAKDISLNTGAMNALGYGVFLVLFPLSVVVAGIIVYRRRRAL